MLRAFLLLLVCVPVFAQAVRVKAERVENKELVTAWGTAWVCDAGCVTCAHVVAGAETIFVETKDGWIRCELKKKDSGADLALLVPRFDIPAVKEPAGFFCWACPLGKPVARFDVKVASDKVLGEHLLIRGFDSGGSGSPVMRDGVLLGICTGQCGLNGAAVKDTARMVSAELVKEFIK